MHRSGLTLALAAAALAAGCSNTPHNNVLLFGTDTKFGIDVSSAATQGGAPQFTVGYRRAEAVWMPLSVNNFNCEPGENGCRISAAEKVETDANGKTTTQPFLYRAVSPNGTGETGDGRADAYSVFASFGAEFSGGATGAEANAAGGLVQFFATGIAAQRLAESDRVVEALKLNSPGAAEGDAAKAEAEARALIAQLDLSEAEKARIVEEQKAVAAAADTNATKIVAQCGGPAAGEEKWKAALEKSGITPDGQKFIFSAKTNAQAIKRIAAQSNFYEPFTQNLSTACP